MFNCIRYILARTWDALYGIRRMFVKCSKSFEHETDCIYRQFIMIYGFITTVNCVRLCIWTTFMHEDTIETNVWSI